MEEMEKALKSPWLTVSLAIVAMTIGYVLYMQDSGASAAGHFCPAKQVCDSKECLENGCDKEGCQRCPGCKGKTS